MDILCDGSRVKLARECRFFCEGDCVNLYRDSEECLILDGEDCRDFVRRHVAALDAARKDAVVVHEEHGVKVFRVTRDLVTVGGDFGLRDWVYSLEYNVSLLTYREEWRMLKCSCDCDLIMRIFNLLVKDERVCEMKPKRWRADGTKIQTYWYVGTDGFIYPEREFFNETNNRHYNFGNYFRTKTEAQQAAEAVRETLMKFHELNQKQ